jgi:hypothetical protein
LGRLDKSLDSLFGRARCFFDQRYKLRDFRAIKYRVHNLYLIVAQMRASKPKLRVHFPTRHRLPSA